MSNVKQHMLQFAAPVLSFSTHRAPFHDGMNEEEATFVFACPVCAGAVSRNVFSAISSGETWYRSLPRQDQQALAAAFGFTFSIEGPKEIPYAWMLNGRHAYFTSQACPSCGSESVAAIDFYEKQPARYVGVLEGLVSCHTQSEGGSE